MVACHGRVHVVEGGHVGELQDRFVGEMAVQDLEEVVAHPAAVVDDRVAVRECGAFELRED